MLDQQQNCLVVMSYIYEVFIQRVTNTFPGMNSLVNSAQDPGEKPSQSKYSRLHQPRLLVMSDSLSQRELHMISANVRYWLPSLRR